jgi:tRNA dimethylallyltransferase
MKTPYQLVTVTGPTATGKTAFAAALALQLHSDVISADSRQVYKNMNIGTGKDYHDYCVNGQQVKVHLIDIKEPGTKYSVFEYQHDFFNVFQQLQQQGQLPVLCGGSGLYIEAVLKGYTLPNVPPNPTLRQSLEKLSHNELKNILASYKTLHNNSDLDSVQRTIRAIEIQEYVKHATPISHNFTPPNSLVVALDITREQRRLRISQRLHKRLKEGLVREVKQLLDSGIQPDDLIYYGLEYKFVTLYLIGKLNYDDMIKQLEIAIQQFAKRQMTWFRGMQRRGIQVHWINAELPINEKINNTINLIYNI